MMWLFYILGFIVSVIFIVGVYTFIQRMSRKSRSKNWKIGDVILYDYLNLSYELKLVIKEKKLNSLTLSGWNGDNVFYTVDKTCYCEKWGTIDSNKSQIWRDNYNNCKTFMGKTPAFDEYVKKSSGGFGEKDSVDGVPIETMNETLCQIHLKRAIEEENYELADKIRKRLENFR